jgi:hypothetical protein
MYDIISCKYEKFESNKIKRRRTYLRLRTELLVMLVGRISRTLVDMVVLEQEIVFQITNL